VEDLRPVCPRNPAGISFRPAINSAVHGGGGKLEDVRIGSFSPDRSETLVDARGLVLAPGFIDIHNHSELSGTRYGK